jgi:hypothetical protein
VNPHLSGYRSLERIVLIPCYKEDLGGPAIDDAESLVICLASMPECELGAVVIRLLRDQRPRDFELKFHGEARQRRLAVRRNRLCKAFGVRAAKDWLDNASYVSVADAGGSITVTPYRRDGMRDGWSGNLEDPVGRAVAPTAGCPAAANTSPPAAPYRADTVARHR